MSDEEEARRLFREQLPNDGSRLFFDALGPEAQRKIMEADFAEIIEQATSTARFLVEIGEARTKGNYRELLLALLLGALSIHASTRAKHVSTEEARAIF